MPKNYNKYKLLWNSLCFYFQMYRLYYTVQLHHTLDIDILGIGMLHVTRQMLLKQMHACITKRKQKCEKLRLSVNQISKC